MGVNPGAVSIWSNDYNVYLTINVGLTIKVAFRVNTQNPSPIELCRTHRLNPNSVAFAFQSNRWAHSVSIFRNDPEDVRQHKLETEMRGWLDAGQFDAGQFKVTQWGADSLSRLASKLNSEVPQLVEALQSGQSDQSTGTAFLNILAISEKTRSDTATFRRSRSR